ncbi:MAG: N-acetyltransferase [Acidobacteriota bacterium]|nr:MAG: N-acetyltransferase [Acidobacteriota bacterium]
MIRFATEEDAEGIVHIYNHYVVETCITFETDPVSTEEMVRRIAETISIPLPWLVAENTSGLIGYAYASKWKGRCAYRYSVESTVYLAPEQVGKGYGTTLYAELLARLRALSMHSVIGGIALPNPASICLHERLGFKKVAHFKEVGFKHDQWVDVGYWQLQL